MMMTVLRSLTAAMLALLAGCNRGGHTGPVEGTLGLRLLNFTLLEGRTTDNDILEQWGVPYSVYEDGRIWTYAMVRRSGGILASCPPPQQSRSTDFATWKDETYHLILLFEDGILMTYHLLRIS